MSEEKITAAEAARLLHNKKQEALAILKLASVFEDAATHEAAQKDHARILVDMEAKIADAQARLKSAELLLEQRLQQIEMDVKGAGQRAAERTSVFQAQIDRLAEDVVEAQAQHRETLDTLHTTHATTVAEYERIQQEHENAIGRLETRLRELKAEAASVKV